MPPRSVQHETWWGIRAPPTKAPEGKPHWVAVGRQPRDCRSNHFWIGGRGARPTQCGAALRTLHATFTVNIARHVRARRRAGAAWATVSRAQRSAAAYPTPYLIYIYIYTKKNKHANARLITRQITGGCAGATTRPTGCSRNAAHSTPHGPRLLHIGNHAGIPCNIYGECCMQCCCHIVHIPWAALFQRSRQGNESM
jgi:hypothetical protein